MRKGWHVSGEVDAIHRLMVIFARYRHLEERYGEQFNAAVGDELEKRGREENHVKG